MVDSVSKWEDVKFGNPQAAISSLIARKSGIQCIQNLYILNEIERTQWGLIELERTVDDLEFQSLPMSGHSPVGLWSRAPRSVVKMTLVVSGFGKYEME